jgi:hypothetical protein
MDSAHRAIPAARLVPRAQSGAANHYLILDHCNQCITSRSEMSDQTTCLIP